MPLPPPVESPDELLAACVASCRAVTLAYRKLVRSNVGAACRSRGIEEEAIAEELFHETLKHLHLS